MTKAEKIAYFNKKAQNNKESGKTTTSKAEKIAYFNKKAQSKNESGKTATSKAEKIAYFNKKAGRDDVGIVPYSNAKSAKDLFVNKSLVEKYGKTANTPAPVKYTDTLEKDKSDSKTTQANKNTNETVTEIKAYKPNIIDEAKDDLYNLIFGGSKRRGILSGSKIEEEVKKRQALPQYTDAYSPEQLERLAKYRLKEQEKYGTTDTSALYDRLKENTVTNKNTDLLNRLEEQQYSWGSSPVKAGLWNAGAGVANIGGDIASAVNGLGIGKIPGIKEITNAAIQGADWFEQKAARYNKGLSGQNLGVITQGVVQMLPYVILGTEKVAEKAALNAPKYAEVVSKVFKNPSFWYSLTTQWGGKYQEALDNGANEKLAFANATNYALPAALVEVAGGVGSEGSAEKSLSRTILEEIGEELIQDVISGVSDKSTTKPNLPIVSLKEDAIVNPKDMAQTAFTTAAITAIGAGGSRALQKGVNRFVGNNENNSKGNRVSTVNYLTDNDYDDYIKSGNQHTQHKKSDIVKSGESPILRSKEETDAFIERSLADSNFHSIRAFSKATDRMVKDIAEKSNIDVDGYYLELNSSDILHTAKHKNELKEHQIPLTEDDLKRLPEYMVNYDDVLEVKKQKDGSVKVWLGKKINGHSIVITIASKGRQSMALKSAYFLDTIKYDALFGTKKEEASHREATASNIDTTPTTSENVPYTKSSSDNIITVEPETVNNYDMPNAENNVIADELNFARENASGIEINENDSRKMKLSKKVMRALNERYGVNFKIYSGESLNGFYHNGTVYINEKSEKPILSVIGHEFLHGFKDIDAEGYTLLKSVTESDLRLADYERYKKNLLSDWKEAGIDISALSEPELKNAILEEAMSDMMGEIINDPETIRKIALEDKNLAERIMAYLKDFIEQIRTLFDENDAEIQSIFHNYEQVKAVYQEVVAQSNGRVDGDTVFEDGARLDIKKTIDGKSVVVVDKDILDGKEKWEYKRIAADAIKKLKPGIWVGDKFIKINKDSVDEYTDSIYTQEIRSEDKRRNAKNRLEENKIKYHDKMALSNNLDEVISSTDYEYELPKHERKDSIVNFEVGKVLLQIGDNKYEATVRIGVTSGGEYVFRDVEYLNKVDFKIKNEDTHFDGEKTNLSISGVYPHENKIPQNEDVVNSNNMQNGKIDASDVKLSVRKGSRAEKAQRAMKNYEESGNVADLPTRKWAKAFNRAAINTEKMLENKIATAEWEKRYAKTDEQIKRLDEVLAKLREKQKNNVANLTISGELLGVIGSIERNVNLADIIDQIKDIYHGKEYFKNAGYFFNDFRRNMEAVFGPHFYRVKHIVEGLENAVGEHAAFINEKMAEQYIVIIKGLGIKFGSKESKAIQWIAEGERRPNIKRKADVEALKKLGITNIKNLDPGKTVPYTEETLRAEFGDEKAERILKAEQWYRKQYDEMINLINEILKKFHPNSPEKWIAKRKNYMRHFKELKTGYKAIIDLMKTDAEIAPGLVMISDNTKPKTKWASIVKERKGNETDEGALEGFTDYIPQAAYAIYINPYIDIIRGLGRDLAELKSAGAEIGTDENGKPIKRQTDNSDLNGFIKYLGHFANQLAGKTHPWDRSFMEMIDNKGSGRGRKTLKAFQIINGSTMVNQIVGTISTMLKQPVNMRNSIAYLHNPAHLFTGIWKTFEGVMSYGASWIEEKAEGTMAGQKIVEPLSAKYKGTKVGKRGLTIEEAYQKSKFLKARYKDKAFSKYKKVKVDLTIPSIGGYTKEQIKSFLTFMLGLTDEFGTRATWNAFYYEAVKEGQDDPISYADVYTKKAVGSRSIGEIPLALESQFLKMFLPYRIEPNNDWNVVRDMISGRTPKGKLPDYGDRALKVFMFYLVSLGMNTLMKELTGTGAVFDPFGDIIEGLLQGWKEEEEEENVLTKLGTGTKRATQNVAGDFLSNMSFGFAVTSFLDAISDDWATTLFNDSIYQSAGVNIPAFQSGIKVGRKVYERDWIGAAATLGTSFILPYGGNQLDKTIRGIGDVARGGNYQSNIYKEWSTGERGDMYYPIDKTAGNYIKAGVFGPSSLKANNEYWENKKLEDYKKAENTNAEEKAAEEFFKVYKKENPNSEVVRLYNEIKRKDIFPFEPVESTGSYTNNKVKTEYVLNDKDRAKYQKMLDEKIKIKYNETFESEEYKKADAQTKREKLIEARKAAIGEVKEQIKNDHIYGVIK